MIKFFRKIRQKALVESKFGKYITYAIGEIILVVIGILIALSINNWNQKKSERKIEQAYISSLIEDAKTDLANFQKIIAINEKRTAVLDSLAYICLNYDSEEKRDADFMIWYMKSLQHPNFVAQTDRTLSQLKNSGGMRLIKDKTKIDAIIKYEESFEKLYNQQVWYEGGLNELVDAGIPVFNYKFVPKPNQKFDEESFRKTAKLRTTDQNLIVTLGNRATVYNLLTHSYIGFLKEGNKECLQLIDILQDKDGVEGEK